MNKRRHQRMEVYNLVADVSDGISFFSGTVCNVSRHGVQIHSIPSKIKKQANALSILISVNGVLNFKKMRGIPRWVTENTDRKKMGIQITDASSSWTVFVKNFESKETDSRADGYE